MLMPTFEFCFRCSNALNYEFIFQMAGMDINSRGNRRGGGHGGSKFRIVL